MQIFFRIFSAYDTASDILEECKEEKMQAKRKMRLNAINNRV